MKEITFDIVGSSIGIGLIAGGAAIELGTGWGLFVLGVLITALVESARNEYEW